MEAHSARISASVSGYCEFHLTAALRPYEDGSTASMPTDVAPAPERAGQALSGCAAADAQDMLAASRPLAAGDPEAGNGELRSRGPPAHCAQREPRIGRDGDRGLAAAPWRDEGRTRDRCRPLVVGRHNDVLKYIGVRAMSVERPSGGACDKHQSGGLPRKIDRGAVPRSVAIILLVLGVLATPYTPASHGATVRTDAGTNDHLATAESIGPHGRGEFTARIDFAGDVDVYRLDLGYIGAPDPNPDLFRAVSLWFTGGGGCRPGIVRATVLNAAGKPVGWRPVVRDPTRLPEEEPDASFAFTPRPGTYYLLVDNPYQPECVGATYRVVAGMLTLTAGEPVVPPIPCQQARAEVRKQHFRVQYARKAIKRAATKSERKHWSRVLARYKRSETRWRRRQDRLC